MPTQFERFISTVGYLGVLCILPLWFLPKSAFAQHHGKQGLVIFISWLILWAGNLVPILGQIVWVLGSLSLLILVLLGMVNASAGRLWEMPVLGSYAKRVKL